MKKIQFLKLQTYDDCCYEEVNKETRIIEWRIMNIGDFWEKMYEELEFEKYVSKYSSKPLKELQKALLDRGNVQAVTDCTNCKIIYLFQSLEEEMLDGINMYGKKIKTIEEVAENINCNEDLFKYVVENYKLPSWFNFTVDSDDYEWLCENIMKDGKQIKRPKTILNNMVKNNDIIETEKYIYSNKLVDMYYVLLNFFSYLNETEIDEKINDDKIDKLLSIKVNDFDWYHKWKIPKNEINSNTFIFQKITDESDEDSSNSSISSDSSEDVN